jgi:hypothetical protein
VRLSYQKFVFELYICTCRYVHGYLQQFLIIKSSHVPRKSEMPQLRCNFYAADFFLEIPSLIKNSFFQTLALIIKKDMYVKFFKKYLRTYICPYALTLEKCEQVLSTKMLSFHTFQEVHVKLGNRCC